MTQFAHAARPDSARHRLSLRPGPLLFESRILEQSAATTAAVEDRQTRAGDRAQLGSVPGSSR